MSRMMKVAIVDDEADMRQSISQWLALSGFDTETYGSAEEALAIIEAENFSVFFIDLFLPGMNGLDLCKIVRRRSPKGFIYAITAHTLRYDIADCREAGFDDVFHKPIEGRILLEAAANAFAALQARGAHPDA